MLALARRMGVNVVAVARREEALEGLREAGAALALVDDDGWPEAARQALGEPVHRALDGVGGASTERLGALLADGGRIVSFGAMSRESPRVRVSDGVYRGVLLQGFWLNRLDRMRGDFETGRILNRMVELGIEGRVDSTWALDDLHAALERDRSPERRGRVVLVPGTVWS